MPIKVDPQKCIGCATCVAIDPDNFALDSSTALATVKGGNITQKTKQAASTCPVNAILINHEK